MIKNKIHFLLAAILLVYFNYPGEAQNIDGPDIPVFHGIDFGAVDQITLHQSEQIRKTLDSAGRTLKLETDTSKDVFFSLPVKLKDGISDYGFYTITGYVDHDATYPDNLLDYNCGNITYDVSTGYNHQGTDFYSWPFSWLRMQNDEVEVVAAAPGTIIYKSDGNFDQNCSMNSDTWNAVYIQHADGSTAWYGHMKKNSLTTKAVGETVATGEYLGVMGSSGSSTGPHLHFEVYNSSSSLIDPFQGSCNNFNSNTWWQSQVPYKDAAINRLQTCNHVPVMPDCPGIEIPNETDYFNTGDTVFVVSWFRNLSTNDVVDIALYRPDNSLFYSDTWISSWPFYQAAWLYYYFILDSGDPSGLWHAEISYKGELYTKQFYYNVGTSISEISDPEFLFTQDENYIYLSFLNPENSKPFKWKLLDTSGKTIEEENMNAIETKSISIASLPKGIYFLILESQNKNYFGKVFRLK